MHSPNTLALLGVGAVTGALAGVLGVGGGIVMVPALIWLRMPHRQAVGTSLATIIPISASGLLGYAQHGTVSWFAVFALVLGSIGGAMLGARILARVEIGVFRILFATMLLGAIIALGVTSPSRAPSLGFDWATVLTLVGVGLLAGTASGLIGVGGGSIIVPALVLLGLGDLTARGTSLAVMIPTSVSGVLSHVKKGNVRFKQAAAVSVTACVFAWGGSQLASVMPESLLGTLLVIFLLVVFAQTIRKIAQDARKRLR